MRSGQDGTRSGAKPRSKAIAEQRPPRRRDPHAAARVTQAASVFAFISEGHNFNPWRADNGEMRALWTMTALITALALAGCSDSAKDAKDTKGEKGDIGEKGEAGAPGPPGPKGDPGPAGTAFRVVAPQSSTASCAADELMISAYCTGTFTTYPLVPLANGARCGNNPNSTTLRVTIVCAKR